MTRQITEHEREKFGQYVFEMDDVLEDFVGEAGALGFSLDYSMASLGSLELFMLERIGSDAEQVKNRAARYVGEVFRRNVAGYWDLYDDNPDDLHYGLPVITGFSSKDFDFCPIEIIENFAYKRELGLIERAYRYHERYADKAAKGQKTKEK